MTKSNEELNGVAVALARQLREAMEAELVDLDAEIAKSEHRYDELVEQVRVARKETNDLMNARSNKKVLIAGLSEDIRDLLRPRDGYPQLDDDAYEMRMIELRVTVQSATEDLSKRATWSE